MSNTAIIVSGILRHLVNASSSWTIPGDYFLIVDKDIYVTASEQIVGNSFDILSENINNCYVKFKSVFVCIENELPVYMKAHPTINMVNKWKLAYYNLLPFNIVKNYDRIIILRPDIYLFPKNPIRKLLDIVPQNNEIYTTSIITKSNSDQHEPRDIISDVLLMVNLNTLGRLGNEFGAYYIENYRTAHDDIHSLMAKFIIEKNITVKSDMFNYFEFAILRENCKDLFEVGTIRRDVSFADIKNKEQEWYKEIYEKNSSVR
jgi:hypothetical protein